MATREKVAWEAKETAMMMLAKIVTMGAKMDCNGGKGVKEVVGLERTKARERARMENQSSV
jgi:hypothetical protein